MVILFYAALFGLTFGWQQIRAWFVARRQNLAQGIAIPVLTMLGVATVFVWRMAFNALDGLLHLTVLDIGSGDAILLQTPGGLCSSMAAPRPRGFLMGWDVDCRPSPKRWIG